MELWLFDTMQNRSILILIQIRQQPILLTMLANGPIMSSTLRLPTGGCHFILSCWIDSSMAIHQTTTRTAHNLSMISLKPSCDMAVIFEVWKTVSITCRAWASRSVTRDLLGATAHSSYLGLIPCWQSSHQRTLGFRWLQSS